MPTQQLTDSLIDDYVAKFAQLGQQDQTTLLSRLTESIKKDNSPPRNIPEMYFLPKPPNAPSFEELAGS